MKNCQYVHLIASIRNNKILRLPILRATKFGQLILLIKKKSFNFI